MTTREALIAAMQADGADAVVKVDIPRWGAVYVRPVTVEEAERYSSPQEGDERSQIAVLAARVICDEKGERIFDPDDPEDVALLAKRRSADLMKVITAGTDSGN